MTLSDYLTRHSISRQEFAKTIGVSSEAVRRYMGTRVPTAEIMREIIKATNGEVTANDFFKVAA
jgi:predicted transcriptional regulator